jgi:hypothetical protein
MLEIPVKCFHNKITVKLGPDRVALSAEHRAPGEGQPRAAHGRHVSAFTEIQPSCFEFAECGDQPRRGLSLKCGEPLDGA